MAPSESKAARTATPLASASATPTTPFAASVRLPRLLAPTAQATALPANAARPPASTSATTEALDAAEESDTPPPSVATQPTSRYWLAVGGGVFLLAAGLLAYTGRAQQDAELPPTARHEDKKREEEKEGEEDEDSEPWFS